MIQPGLTAGEPIPPQLARSPSGSGSTVGIITHGNSPASPKCDMSRRRCTRRQPAPYSQGS